MSDKFQLGHAEGIRGGTCPTCYGLIMDPNTVYAYAGKVCQCNYHFNHVTPQHQPTYKTDRDILLEIRDLLKMLIKEGVK